MNNKQEDENHQLFFVKKTDLLNNINQIYDCLLDITAELESTKDNLKKIRDETYNLKMSVRHLKNILQKDLMLREQTKDTSINLNAIKMSVKEWNEYINRSRTVSHADVGQNSDNSFSTGGGDNKLSSITSSYK